MTARDDRLEAAMKAIHWTDGKPVEMVARQFLEVYDAVRAFEVKRFLDTPYQAPAASPVGADPPWLDDLEIKIDALLCEYANKKRWNYTKDLIRAVLAFAAAQPPSEGEIEAAGKEIVARLHLGELSLDTKQRIASAALLAAARVRAGG